MPTKRRRETAPPPLGVLEFSSALNGDDPLSIYQKLLHFVNVVRYERHVSLLDPRLNHHDGDGDTVVSGGDDAKMDEDSFEKEEWHAHDDFFRFDDIIGDAGSGHYDTMDPSKRQKLNDDTTITTSTSSSKQKSKIPSWKLDTNNYQVPFIGTSVAKGPTGSLRPNAWPTGFLEAYRKSSPYGVELLNNEFISALPSEGSGVHANLCKRIADFGSGGESSGKGKQRRGNFNTLTRNPPTQGQILSMAIQCIYWNSLSEWILGFVPMHILKNELCWMTDDDVLAGDSSRTWPRQTDVVESTSEKKCTVPPSVMTILMKSRLPEWVDAVHNYSHQLQMHAQQRQKEKQQLKQQTNKKKQQEQPVAEQEIQDKQDNKGNEKQQFQYDEQLQREAKLFLSALNNLISLCHLSNGTAREVLRRLMMTTPTTAETTGKRNIDKSNKPGAGADGTVTPWMVQVFQKPHCSKSIYRPHMECLRLVCTLLETEDCIIISRLMEHPSSGKQGGGGGGGRSKRSPRGGGSDKNDSMARIALRFGMQILMELVSDSANDRGSMMYARYIARLLRGVREIILPRSFQGSSFAKESADGSGIAKAVELLSGEVLTNLTKLSMLAPPFDADAKSIQDIIDAKESYVNLSPVKSAAIEARRILFLLLADTNRSPFLHGVHNKSKSIPLKNTVDEQSMMLLPQLSKALHCMLGNQGYAPSFKILLGKCLRATPELVPHFFSGLQLSDAKPSYRSLAALTFIEGVLREAPLPPVTSRSLPMKHLISSLFPSCITKLLLGKIIQSQCSLLVSSELKLIISILRRGIAFTTIARTDTISDQASADQWKSSISQAIIGHIPEVTLLLSIPNRFDPFMHDATSFSNSFVVMLLCEALQCFTLLDPSLMKNVKFDWTKLVPNENDGQKMNGRVFSNAEPLLQQRILNCLYLLSCRSLVTYSTKLLPNVISILISTTIPEVYTNARNLALVLMERNLFSSICESETTLVDSENRECMKYETSLWIDGISDDVIQELVSKVEESKHQRVQQKIMVSQAWSKTFAGLVMPSLNVSSYLISSISSLVCDGNSSSSRKLSDLSIQVATRMLLFQADPRPLAAIIVFCTSARILGDKRVAGLYRCAKYTLDHETKVNVRGEPLSLDSFHPERSGLVSKLALLDRSADSTTVRQYLSMMKYSKGQKEQVNIRVRRIIIGFLESGNSMSSVSSRLGELTNANKRRTSDSESYTALLHSALVSKRLSSEIEYLLNCVASSKLSSIATEVTSELLRCSLVPTRRDGTFVSDLMLHCFYAFQSKDERTSGLKHFLVVLLHALLANEKFVGFSPTAMFDLWSAVASNLTSKMSIEFSIKLERILSALFMADDGQGAWAIYQRICSLSPTEFVDTWLDVQLEKGEVSFEHGCSLLRSVLEYDCSQFECLLNLFTSVGSDDRTTTLWERGSLDTIAATFVVQSKKQNARSIIADASLADVSSTISRRFLALLCNRDPEGTQLTTTEILATLDALRSNRHVIPEMQQSILSMFDDSGGLSVDDIGIMNLAISLETHGQDVSLLSTKVFLRGCQLLPKHMKAMLRTKERAAAFAVDSLVGLLSTSISVAETFDENTVSSQIIDNCIVSCLKYGMMEHHDETTRSILGGCLKMIRLLMSKVHCPASKSQIPLERLTPSQVHAMVVSHSSFHHCISQRKCELKEESGISANIQPEYCNGLSRQIELIRLLLCTASLDARHVKVEIETWTVILSVYNASTDYADELLRRLMFLYERNGCCQNEILLTDLRWGTVATKISDEVDENWIWFVDAIDFDRIRLTLSNFPVEDALEPRRFNDVEFSFSDEIDDEADDASSSVTAQRKGRDADCSRDSGCFTRSGTGEDLRYSPGFMLPLILATLDDQLPLEKEQSNKYVESDDEGRAKDKIVNRDEDTIAEHRTFAYRCRRVADRGGIALAIASLSSRCPSLRKMAIAICGLFLKALQMEEAHGTKSWRERPQQEMIMSSIQRGLTVRRSIQIQKKDAHEGGELLGLSATDVHKYKVPMLPAVSAIFLAKVLLILSKPDDDMYGQMNRYFLRLTDYHGAFQDCFGIPAFLSLYCSSSDDLSRSRIERNWALRMLKDSVVDEYCYRIISQHHVPELVMSSFDCMLDDPDSKTELYLTIDVIGTFLQAGGKNASDHLIKRQGILSWLHGILSWRQIPRVFPDVALKCKFLNLITTAVDSYRCYGHEGDDEREGDKFPFYEKVPLAHVVIRLCLDGIDSAEKESINTLLESTCSALWSIYLADNQSRDSGSFHGLTSIRDMSSLLKQCVCLGKSFEKVLASFCDLPVIFDEHDYSSAKLFCCLALSFMLEMKKLISSGTIALCMKRVYELVKHNPCLQNDADLLTLIVNCRHLAVMAGCIDAWSLFLPYAAD